MEPDIMPYHSSSPPPLDDDGDGEAGSEEDEFGDFGGFSVRGSGSPPGFADSSDSPPSLRYPSPTIKPDTHQPNCSFNRPAEQFQPTSTVNSESSGVQIHVEGQDCNVESRMHLTNGYSESSPREETGFADFTVFADQTAHPWCCGFTPLSSTEQWDGRVAGTKSSNSLGEQICDPGQEVIMDSEPRSHGAYKAKGNVCSEVEHCEKRDAALVQPSQDHHQPQEAAAAFLSEEPHSGEEQGHPRDGQRERRHSVNSLQTDKELQKDGESEDDRDDREQSISSVPQTFSVYESASDDLASFCDDLSFECPSADLEPNVSSLASQEDQTDWDQTDDEDEELGNYRRSASFVNNSMTNLRQSKEEKGFHHCDQSATQETSSTSNQSQSGTDDCSFESHRDQDHVQTADAGVQSLGNLPPSDSFADFCSAPTQEDGEESWAEFKEQRGQIDGSTEEEQDRAEQYGVSRRNSSQASLSCRVQQLLLASFPEIEVPAVEGEEEVLSLGALLHAQHLPESEEIPELCPPSQWIQRGMWWPHQDLHSAVGLQFQWGGSHTNRTVLRCLGMDTRNIAFIGMKKQPVAVPAFASSLGMLEPTKDSVSAVCSPGHTVVTAQEPPGSWAIPAPSTMQEVPPSRQLDWSSRGLSSSQDDCTALNLDYFGPEEEGRSYSSSSSRSNSPPPGVDRELYELTISKLETGVNSSHMEDTLNRLMSTAEKTSTSVRKSQQDEELSVEAGRVISGLPNLSFMLAKVLMFPSILVPKECCSPKLQ
ncbi:aftiphilin isoform X1 [Micropterus dolomieu]|uniref:aftiphilin isoform X1 n=1 Tax=Micropterus dolomieu TaxID=147949 RepID=UPI001E8E6C33|nr:aftiphilin isoform X1 [Micropterus dolomieu]XP_045926070.1 aftiphilin isoform X1 [Micropterus dolomieu]XP_045926071.1 aftiphilin isoform X1 [Micropterus dolomieu]XP_045926072.1 aftiphilin isoform X1 [Micropterus dolomieu]XP_045926073.1 aftiphilin isoform X1 [Micropterus dolomieu]XP_045926074.1 aftiphilin isoform X1 [Micropterus dolomieu]XP_045926075.1 aftiphilin isoform X1 [Micropterus dolomieu]